MLILVANMKNWYHWGLHLDKAVNLTEWELFDIAKYLLTTKCNSWNDFANFPVLPGAQIEIRETRNGH
jgi:hypothetical protein